MSQIPSITVIIPLYNKVAEVERALTSILAQTIQEFELLIIDGGSTDGSLEKVAPYLKDTRIKLINQKGKGLPGARNEAIAAASGELITFLDADDEWYPDFLETIIHLYQTYPGAGIYGTAYERCALVTSKPSPLGGLPSVPFEGYLPSYFKVYVESGFPPFCPCCVALSRDVFSKTGYFNENSRMSEDVEMWVKVAYHSRIVFTSEIHARYHLYADNKMSLDYYPIKQLPPLTYLLSLPEDEVKSRADADDIAAAIEYLWLITAYFNIGCGCKRYAKEALSHSHSRAFWVKRAGMKVLSVLPKCVGMWVIAVYAHVPYVVDWVMVMERK